MIVLDTIEYSLTWQATDKSKHLPLHTFSGQERRFHRKGVVMNIHRETENISRVVLLVNIYWI
jgi:hypothetical protein